MTTVNVTTSMSMTKNDWKHELTFFIILCTGNMNWFPVVFGHTHFRRNVYSCYIRSILEEKK